MLTARVKSSVSSILNMADALPALILKNQCTLLLHQLTISFNQVHSIKDICFNSNKLQKETSFLITRIIKSIFNEMFGNININSKRWPTGKISDLFNLQMGKTPSRANNLYWDKPNHKWLSISDLNNANNIYIDTKEKISDIAVKESGIKLVPKNTVLMSFKLSIGKTIITNENIFTNEAIMAFLPKTSYISNQYLSAFLSNFKWLQVSSSAVKGSTLNKSIIGSTQLPIPSFNLQDNYSDIIGQRDKLKLIAQQIHKKIECFKKSIFNEMFGDRNFNCYTLEQVCTFIDYRGKTPEKSNSGYRLITAKNIKNNHFVSEPQEFILPETYKEFMQRGYPKIGDILFTTEAPLGNVCKIPDIPELKPKFGVGQRIVTLQPYNNLLDPTFLEYVLLSKKFQAKLFQKKSGSTVIGIRSKLLKQLTIPVPEYRQQLIFTNIVNQIDKLKLNFNNFIQNIIQQYIFDKVMKTAIALLLYGLSLIKILTNSTNGARL